ncbi:SDR family NAD(P)-dependent oxidoreductase [Corynebacterium sp. zg254]|uniref:SDR family oxidoreductase n=1 Tax=Corynebacterium zhongnanshanii TaxID=2768834 RepID=A0ABQ6VGF0_9CORY|nr:MULTISPECIES: SDR family oxidoreductase [Corynebacterium]KAB3523269.1 SDR family oxidoreductase [Corynebacterium zhongnanshanii]MCR5913613.1 SDR family NAD(P)-dependent oxidoreductase [Corynebacterium sp. zg254]
MKVAVITGAGGGLGRVFSTALAADGWAIAAVGRTEKTLQDTLGECQDGDHRAFICDITDASSVHSIFEQIVAHYGHINVLINNAGVPGPTGRIDSIDVEEFDAAVATNLRGTFLCSQAAFAHMADTGGGRIINNGSIAAHSPRPAAATYAATKAAIASLTTSLSLDGRGLGIVATELDIGNAKTDLLGAFTGEEPMFHAIEAGRMIVALANLPLTVSADQVTLTAAGMPYLGRG